MNHGGIWRVMCLPAEEQLDGLETHTSVVTQDVLEQPVAPGKSF